MDATHDMNGLRWYLFTVMVRHECNKYHPCAHMLCDGQDSLIVSQFLTTVKRWCRWIPRYFLTDDSAAKLLAVKRAFPGLIKGEPEATHLLCRVHSKRTLERNLKQKDKITMGHLMAALKYCRTSMGCDNSLKSAVRAATTEKTKDYIRKEWMATNALWANYPRAHSPLLL